MRIIKNEGKFEILSKTEDIIWQIANAARTCYKSFDKASPENDIKLVQNLKNRGHFAMYEFADMTVKFDDVSRGVTHELVRHRLASYAQESTRYVDESDLNVVVPPHKDEYDDMIEDMNTGLEYGLEYWFRQNEHTYRSLLAEGYKPEDARQVLPIGTKAPICIKANMKEWRHIFFMRCDKFAHWEIRKVMLDLLKYCKENIPVIFDDFYFFKTEDGKEYARPVISEFNLKDAIQHYIIANMQDDDDPRRMTQYYLEQAEQWVMDAKEIFMERYYDK